MSTVHSILTLDIRTPRPSIVAFRRFAGSLLHSWRLNAFFLSPGRRDEKPRRLQRLSTRNPNFHSLANGLMDLDVGFHKRRSQSSNIDGVRAARCGGYVLSGRNRARESWVRLYIRGIPNSFFNSSVALPKQLRGLIILYSATGRDGETPDARKTRTILHHPRLLLPHG